MARNGERYRLRMTDMTDRDVLGAVADSLDENGVATSSDVAAFFWPRVMNNGDDDARIQVTRCVGARLSVMRKIGLVEKVGPPTAWALTPVGDDLLNGRLAASAERMLETMKGTPLVLAVHAMTNRRHNTLDTQLIRRAWAYGMRKGT